LAATTDTSVLTDEMLQRFHERAPGYDRDNKFFHEDFEELRDAGYLNITAPTEFGGMGLNLAQTMREQRKLAYHAPATAVAVNMHIYWTVLCADLYRIGDESMK
jgi:alkylation response protein AidB-like acyl-CoA dehydrogenase